MGSQMQANRSVKSLTAGSRKNALPYLYASIPPPTVMIRMGNSTDRLSGNSRKQENISQVKYCALRNGVISLVGRAWSAFRQTASSG